MLYLKGKFHLEDFYMDQDSEKLLIKELKDLKVVLTEVKIYWKKQSSLRWNFLRGILYGFGFFIGATLIAAVFLFALTHLSINSNSAAGKIIQAIINFAESKR